MIFELYPEGWVGFHQADRKGGKRFQAEEQHVQKLIKACWAVLFIIN